MAVNDFELEVSVDKEDNQAEKTSFPAKNEYLPHCLCDKEFCECGSLLKVTKYSADLIYNHLGFKEGRKELVEKEVRTQTLHLWGTDHLSTRDLMNWLNEYNPLNIEWIDDASCNIVFSDENTALRVIVDKTEPFFKGVAMAAAMALLNQYSLSNEFKDVPSLMPKTGNWFKAQCVPDGAFALYIRFADKDDVKQPGAEKRSNYYRLHGKPRDHAPSGSSSSNLQKQKFKSKFQKNESDSIKPARTLVSYSGLYDKNSEDMFIDSNKKPDSQTSFVLKQNKQKIVQNSGSRRLNSEPIPQMGRPKKFPRKDAFITLSDRWSGLDEKGYNFSDSKQSWNGNMTKLKSGIIVGSSMDSMRRGHTRPDDLSEPLAAIKLVPDSSGIHLKEQNVYTSKRLLASLSMVADVEEGTSSTRNPFSFVNKNKTESVYNRLG